MPPIKEAKARPPGHSAAAFRGIHAMEASEPLLSAPPRTVRVLNVIALAWVFLELFQFALARPFMDFDMFHEMALAREAIALGHVPLRDSFAYTPTVFPVVHHEWGMGLLLYLVAMIGGSTGLYLLLLALVIATLLICVAVARVRGAHWPEIILCLHLIGPLGTFAYGAVRAQFITLLFMAVTLFLLELDRRKKRWWIWAGFPLFIIWVNMHGGFLVGLGILVLYWAEMALHTRRWNLRLLLVIATSIALTGISPYGYAHVASVAHAALLPRPFVTEWRPLWSDALRLSIFLGSILPAAYGLRAVGWKRAAGLPLFLVCAYLAFRHMRHLGLYGIAWLCYVPGWFGQTAGAAWFRSFWIRRAALLLPVACMLSLLLLVPIIVRRQWGLLMSVRPDETENLSIYYPVGPVRYLQAYHFSGKVMTPFEMGAYISWKLAPAVKVALDSRYEVAYDPALAAKFVALYHADPGWQDTLMQYPPDLILAQNNSKIAPLLAADPAWTRVYVDDAFSLYAREGVSLPVEDHRGQPLLPLFP